MAKTVPLEIEKEYIKLDKQLEVLTAKHKVVKLQLLKYYEKGYDFTLIRPSDTSGGVLSIPWKTVAMELIHKLFKTKPAREAFMKSLIKRFPRVERAPSLNIPGKKVREHVEA